MRGETGAVAIDLRHVSLVDHDAVKLLAQWPQVSSPAGVTTAAGVNAVSSLEALIALQEVGDPTERRRRAVGRADKILDALDSLKIELLEGTINPAMLERLTRAVREQRSMTDDPKLEDLLDQVETRAAVELAKHEVSTVAT